MYNYKLVCTLNVHSHMKSSMMRYTVGCCIVENKSRLESDCLDSNLVATSGISVTLGK